MPRLHKQTPEEKQTYRKGQRNTKGQTICGAKTRRGVPCPSTKIRANGRCRMHGGNSPSGPNHPNFKDGRYSQDLPTRLAARYQTARADPDLIVLKDEIALVDVRISQLLSRIGKDDSGELWKRVGDAFTKFKGAQARQDTAGAIAALDDLDKLIGKGLGDWAIWKEINEAIEIRRKLSESEQKRLVTLQQFITVEKAMLLIGLISGSVSSIIRKYVTDQVALSNISTDLSEEFRRISTGSTIGVDQGQSNNAAN